MAIKKILKIKFAYVTHDTAKTSIKNHIYRYTTPHKMVICYCDGVTGNRIPHQQGQYYF
jgi:methylglyoxal synthase